MPNHKQYSTPHTVIRHKAREEAKGRQLTRQERGPGGLQDNLDRQAGLVGEEEVLRELMIYSCDNSNVHL